MKTFIQYLAESIAEKKYVFKVKIAGDLPDHCDDVMENSLQKYQVSKFTKTKTTPIQSKLMDFPTMENLQVNIFDIELDYPTTSAVLANCISEHTGITQDRIRVRSTLEEAEAELNAGTDEETSETLLTSDFKKEDNQNLVGTKGLGNFLKDLAKVRKETEPQQYKGTNDALLAKKVPKEKAPTSIKDVPGKSPIGSVNTPAQPKGK